MTQYPITDEIRRKYPEESRRWEELIRKADNPKYHGCYRCRFYRELPEEKCTDVESLYEDVDGDWLPWDSEEAWVYCSLEPEIETPLKINCSRWKPRDHERV